MRTVKRAVKGIKYPAGHPLEGKKKRRTLFARFIAGEHHEECIQQARLPLTGLTTRDKRVHPAGEDYYWPDY